MIRFAGYAALFGRVDRGGDVIERGAFGALPQAAPLLWQHRGAPIGAVERLAVDERGLRVIGRIDAPEPARLVASGALTGLSFGYRVRAAAGRRPRHLTALDLAEVSLVAHPMQPLARVHAVSLASSPSSLLPELVSGSGTARRSLGVEGAADAARRLRRPPSTIR